MSPVSEAIPQIGASVRIPNDYRIKGYMVSSDNLFARDSHEDRGRDGGSGGGEKSCAFRDVRALIDHTSALWIHGLRPGL